MAAAVGGAKWFSVLICLMPSLPFSFTLSPGIYAFTRIAQGFHTAPAVCAIHVMHTWDKLDNQRKVISYIDDILIHCNA